MQQFRGRIIYFSRKGEPLEMPITIVRDRDQHQQERHQISTERITVQLKQQRQASSSYKFAVLVANLLSTLTYKDLKSQVFDDFDALYQKVSDGVFLAIMKDKAQVMKFCKKYNQASVGGQEIRCVPVIKLDYENVVDVQLKQ